MANPNITPVIPPLPDISGSPQPPVIPSLPSTGAPIPSWTHPPQHPANYPIYRPYTTPNGTPTMVPVQMSGEYTPPAPPPGAMPSGYIPPSPPTPIYPHEPPLPGLLMDYTGYPMFSADPGPYGPPPPALHPHSPWAGLVGTTSASPQPQAPPWQAHRQPYPQFQQPLMTAPMYQGGPPPPAWGPGGFTPGHGQGMMPLDPYMGGVSPWFQQHDMQPAPPPMQLPQHLQGGPKERANAKVGDRIDRFMAGNHYGPVLEPFILRVVGAQISVNPLIQPPPEDGSDRPHLQWNMVYPSAQCRKSTDDAQVSWHSGRDQPATFPRIMSMRIVSDLFPWIFTVTARDRTAGVTCGEVIDTLSEHFSRRSSDADYDTLSTRRKDQVSEAYQYNRSTAHGVPGGTLGQGMRCLDFLGKDVKYGGIVLDVAALRRICGDVLPCVFVLNCQRRALTQEEIREEEEIRKQEEFREQESRQRTAEAEENRKRATVTADTKGGDRPRRPVAPGSLSPDEELVKAAGGLPIRRRRPTPELRNNEELPKSTSGLPASQQRSVPEVWIEPPESPKIDLSQTPPSGDACAAQAQESFLYMRERDSRMKQVDHDEGCVCCSLQ